jgi:transposase-like protein
LICPECHTHNGLADPSRKVRYVCPNCETDVTREPLLESVKG